MPDSNLRRIIAFTLPMKRLGLTLALPPAMLFLFTGLRAADTQPATAAATAPVPAAATVQRAPENALPPGRMTAEEILKRFDKNGDGKLDEDEAAAAHEAMLDAQMQRRAAATAAKPGQIPPRLLAMFDRNHDGQLDDAERAEMRKYLETHGPAGGGGALMGMRQEIVRRFDQNHDGKIDDAEWAELGPVLRQRLEAMLQQLHRIDKNGDGIIDDEEWAAATGPLRQWLDEGPAAPAPKKAPAAPKPADAEKAPAVATPAAK